MRAVSVNSEVSDRSNKAPADEAFDAGYRQATQDILDWLVYGSEEFLRERTSATQELRKAVYGLVDRIEKRIEQNQRDQGYVEGGLGI